MAKKLTPVEREFVDKCLAIGVEQVTQEIKAIEEKLNIESQ